MQQDNFCLLCLLLLLTGQTSRLAGRCLRILVVRRLQKECSRNRGCRDGIHVHMRVIQRHAAATATHESLIVIRAVGVVLMLQVIATLMEGRVIAQGHVSCDSSSGRSRQFNIFLDGEWWWLCLGRLGRRSEIKHDGRERRLEARHGDDCAFPKRSWQQHQSARSPGLSHVRHDPSSGCFTVFRFTKLSSIVRRPTLSPSLGLSSAVAVDSFDC